MGQYNTPISSLHMGKKAPYQYPGYGTKLVFIAITPRFNLN